MPQSAAERPPNHRFARAMLVRDRATVNGSAEGSSSSSVPRGATRGAAHSRPSPV